MLLNTDHIAFTNIAEIITIMGNIISPGITKPNISFTFIPYNLISKRFNIFPSVASGTL